MINTENIQYKVYNILIYIIYKLQNVEIMKYLKLKTTSNTNTGNMTMTAESSVSLLQSCYVY